MNIANLIELAISLSLELWLIALLVRVSALRNCPRFFAFVAVSASANAARLLTVSNYRIYFFVFWCGEALFLLFGLAALDEIFRKVYEGFMRLRWFQPVYYGVITLVLLVALWHALASRPMQADLVIGLILNIGIAVNLLQLSIVALFSALLHPMGIGFWRYPFGIAAGFAVSAMGPAVSYFLRSIFGKKLDVFTQNASAVAYILALLIWVATFAWPEPKQIAWKARFSPEEMLDMVNGYLRALGLGRKDNES